MSHLPASPVVALLGVRHDQGPLERVLQRLVDIATCAHTAARGFVAETSRPARPS